MMRRKSPRSGNIYLIENHCQTNISKGRGGNEFNSISRMTKNEIITLSKPSFKPKDLFDLIFSQTYSEGSDFLRIITIAFF